MTTGGVIAMVEMTTGRASEGGHWYTRDGECCYDIRGANGKMRPVTLRDARKLNLLPGVSSILRMEHKEALQVWLLDQAYMAALTLPQIPGETLSAFKERCKVDAAAQADKARDRGTWLHAALQGYFEGRPVADQDLPYVMPVVGWLGERFGFNHRWLAESSFGCELGYGGKADLRSAQVPIVIDFKFKDIEADHEKQLAYSDHAMQLWAYDYGFGYGGTATKLNLFISSTVPSVIFPHEWGADSANEFEAFKCLLRLWQLRKNYTSAWSHEQEQAA